MYCVIIGSCVCLGWPRRWAAQKDLSCSAGGGLAGDRGLLFGEGGTVVI